MKNPLISTTPADLAEHLQTRQLQRRHVLRASAAFSLLGTSVLLTACGGGDDDVKTPPTVPPVTPTEPTTPPAVKAPTLVGRAVIPSQTFVAGPTSGQFISGGDYDRSIQTYGIRMPFVGQQPVQGFSALIAGPVAGTYYALQDNGFGGRGASPDALQHVYAIKPDWTTGKVTPVHFETGELRTEFTPDTFIRLSDPHHQLGYTTVADMEYYPGNSVSPAGQRLPVDAQIKAKRWLTGYDMDPESIQRDAQGNFWIGDEFGPFLLKFNGKGELIAGEIHMPNLSGLGSNKLIQTPNNPYLGDHKSQWNLEGSGGLESMAIDTKNGLLYLMYEKAIEQDDRQRRVITVYDMRKEVFLPKTYSYKVSVAPRVNGNQDLETEYFSVNDMAFISDREYLVVEKDGGAGDVRTGKFPASGTWRNAARFKRVYRVNLDKVDSNGFLIKEEIVDLMNVLDPKGLGGSDTIDGIFTFPMECVEAVMVVDANTLALVNDNNYPGGSPSRITSKPDDNEFILIRLPQPLWK